MLNLDLHKRNAAPDHGNKMVCAPFSAGRVTSTWSLRATSSGTCGTGTHYSSSITTRVSVSAPPGRLYSLCTGTTVFGRMFGSDAVTPQLAKNITMRSGAQLSKLSAKVWGVSVLCWVKAFIELTSCVEQVWGGEVLEPGRGHAAARTPVQPFQLAAQAPPYQVNYRIFSLIPAASCEPFVPIVI